MMMATDFYGFDRLARGRTAAIAVLGVTLFFTASFLASGGFSQRASSGKKFPTAKYNDLYDAIFPRATKSFDPMQAEYAIDVRVRPSFRAPSQISITKARDGKFIVRHYILSKEGISLAGQISSLLNSGADSSVESLSKKLGVVSTEYRTPSRLIPLIEGFFAPMTVPKTTSISLDGVGYDVWYIDSGSSVSISLAGGDEYENGEATLITWARRLQKEARRQR